MRVVVIGAGEVGFPVASKLASEGHDVTVVERDEDLAAKVEDELDVMVVRGNGARPQVLERAGVAPGLRTDLLIACTDRDEVNILACWIARRAGVEKVMGRARSLEFTDTDTWARELDIDMLISPERSAAREIEELLLVASAVRTVEIASGKAALYAFRVAEDASMQGVSMAELRSRYSGLSAINVYVDREGGGFVPSGDSVLEPGDLCYVVTFRDQVGFLETLFDPRKRRPLHRVLVVGGGKIGYQVAHRLERRSRSIDIRLIDRDREKCDRIARELGRTVVLAGDGTDRDLLEYEGVREAEGFVTTTSSDESNILIGVLGKSLGAAKAVAVVRRNAFMQMHAHLDIDAMVNPHMAMASVIMQHVKFPRASGHLSVLESIGAEMMEGTIPDQGRAAGCAVRDIGLPRGIILALVERGTEAFVPWGDTVLQGGDRVILFSSSELMSRAVELLEVR